MDARRVVKVGRCSLAVHSGVGSSEVREFWCDSSPIYRAAERRDRLGGYGFTRKSRFRIAALDLLERAVLQPSGRASRRDEPYATTRYDAPSLKSLAMSLVQTLLPSAKTSTGPRRVSGVVRSPCQTRVATRVTAPAAVPAAPLPSDSPLRVSR